ncbi:MAG: radical SAM protein [Candidatus Eremiobacteraeota bacterium]|nr:radical SAM protein [Candidatus Eremiobacteraeota bacterium]
MKTRTAAPAAVFARADGSVLDIPDFAAAADGGCVMTADAREFIPLPPGSLLLTLPGRSVVGYRDGAAVAVHDIDGERVDAVAAALPLGYTRTLLPAYETRLGAPPLPLYGYAAVAWHEGALHAAAMRTDHLEWWSPGAHEASALRGAIAARRREMKAGPLLAQLERCALEYGCYTAQNAFLRHGEAAIPVSPACNARCIGCISEQEPDAGVKSAQERVRTLPAVQEMVELAVPHLEGEAGAMVSFGQGCEGEPLLAAPRIAAAIREIRARTNAGTIHLNTNASVPRALEELIDAGLQSIRVSLNAARPQTYAAYYRPRGYALDDVVKSIWLARERGLSISLNLLTHPGVTDDPDEIDAFESMLSENPVDMVQTRTLNVDPDVYFEAVGRPEKQPIGMRHWFEWMRQTFPSVRLGNFTRGFG